LDRLQKTLVSVFESALDGQSPVPEVHWALTEPTQEQLSGSFVALRMIAGPSPFNRDRARSTLLNPATSIDITVSSVEVGRRYTARLNGFNYFTDAIGGDTVTTIRDRLRAAVNADTLEPVTASDVGADVFRLTADFNGAMRTLQIYGLLTAAAPVVSDQSVNLVEGEQQMLVNVQAYSKHKGPREGAPMLTQICYAALQTRGLSQELHANGIGIWNKGVPTDLSTVIGGRWETRSSFDLTLAMHAAWVEDVERIESVALTGTFSGITTEQEISA
jgi:hypothetical protein